MSDDHADTGAERWRDPHVQDRESGGPSEEWESSRGPEDDENRPADTGDVPEEQSGDEPGEGSWSGGGEAAEGADAAAREPSADHEAITDELETEPAPRAERGTPDVAQPVDRAQDEALAGSAPLGLSLSPDDDRAANSPAMWASPQAAEPGGPSPAASAGPAEKAQGSASAPRGGRSRHGGSGRGRPGARWWAYLVLVVLAAVCIALIAAVIVKTSDDAADAQRDAAAYTPPPLPTFSARPTVTPQLPVISTIGDGFTAGSVADSGPKAEWPALLGTALGARVVRLAATDSGYVSTGFGSRAGTFVSRASKIAPSSKVVVFFGGASDRSATPVDLASAVTKAVLTAEKEAPNARVVIVGPAVSADPPPSVLRVRDTLRSAAAAVQATWVDPIAGNWLSGPGLTASSGYPTDQGQRAIETRLESVVQPLL